MPNERGFEFDVGAEVGRYFDDSSLSDGAGPRVVILMGGPAAGKTTVRKQRYSTGYVLVDAAEIFLSLSRGEYIDFPGPFDRMLELIGRPVARRAVSERRHIVTELIGADREPTEQLIEAMRAVGYLVSVQGITCDIEEARHRNLARGGDISCYYAEPYQRRWLLEAAFAALHPEEENA
jgi:predicted ATPase